MAEKHKDSKHAFSNPVRNYKYHEQQISNYFSLSDFIRKIYEVGENYSDFFNSSNGHSFYNLFLKKSIECIRILAVFVLKDYLFVYCLSSCLI